MVRVDCGRIEVWASINRRKLLAWHLDGVMRPGFQPALQAVLKARQAGYGQRCKIDAHVVLQINRGQ